MAGVMERRGYYPHGRPGMADLAKMEWNREVEGLVRRAQKVTWEDVTKGWRFIETTVKGGWKDGEGR